jgi:hypothetical protein
MKLASLLGLIGNLRDEADTLEQVEGWLSFYDETFWWVEWYSMWLTVWADILRVWAEVLDLFLDPFGIKKESRTDA